MYNGNANQENNEQMSQLGNMEWDLNFDEVKGGEQETLPSKERTGN